MSFDAASGQRKAGRRTLAALVLLALAAAVMVRLGFWQLSRAQQKIDLAAAVQAGRALPPATLGPFSAAPDLIPSRSVMATGHWLADRTVLLDNRMAGGKPGFWVVTPLAFDAAPGAGRAQAVAVLRGWMARPLPDGPVSVPAPGGPVAIRGELIARVPRLFELSSLGAGNAQALPAHLPAASGMAPRVQNLDLAVYARASGVTLLPALVEQTGGADDGLLREWPQPPSNVAMNRGYALQWFSFAAIAAIAFGAILVRYLRARRQR